MSEETQTPVEIKRGDKIQVRIDFAIESEDDLMALHRAEDALEKLGIWFDRSTEITNGRVVGREWSWDWSLKGPVSVSFSGEERPRLESCAHCGGCGKKIEFLDDWHIDSEGVDLCSSCGDTLVEYTDPDDSDPQQK